MLQKQKVYSSLKPGTLRTRKVRLRSLDHIKLNETSVTNIVSNPESLPDDHPVNITEFVFNSNKKRNEIGRIIDDYFEEQPAIIHFKEPKAFSLIEFTKRGNQLSRRPYLKARLNMPLHWGETGKTDTLETTMLPSPQKQPTYLPPIFEEEPEPPSKFNVLLMKTIKLTSVPSSPRRPSKNQSKERIIQANDKYLISANRKSNHVKSYTSIGMDHLYLELRAYHIAKQLEVDQLFSYSGGNQLNYRLFSPFRKMLYHVSEEAVNGEMCYHITPLPFYSSLFDNQNQLLLRLIKSLLLTVSKIRNRLINVNINLSNLHYHKESLILDSWASASIKETKLNQVILPVLRNQREWLVPLEHLPPEFLDSVLSEENQYDLFQNPSSIDMWSIGSLILELITLIPLNAKERFVINGETKRVMRRGVYTGRENGLVNLIKRQRRLCSRLKPQLEKLGELPENVSPKVLELMTKMLRLDPKQRLTPEEGLKIIQ